jgi:hypothetical protein
VGKTLPRAEACSTRQLARAGLIGCHRLVPPYSINAPDTDLGRDRRAARRGRRRGGRRFRCGNAVYYADVLQTIIGYNNQNIPTFLKFG